MYPNGERRGVLNGTQHRRSGEEREGGAEEGNGGPDGIVHGTGISASQCQDAVFADRGRGVIMFEQWRPIGEGGGRGETEERGGGRGVKEEE